MRPGVPLKGHRSPPPLGGMVPSFPPIWPANGEGHHGRVASAGAPCPSPLAGQPPTGSGGAAAPPAGVQGAEPPAAQRRALLLPRTLRLDGSDAVVFERAAAPGEWAVPGGFCFWDDAVEALSGKRRQAFRAGFLGLSSFGWSTLVEVAEASAAEREAAVAALAAHILAEYGAPDLAAAQAAAEEEVAFAASLCVHPVGTVLALSRVVEGGAVRERFRTLHRRESLPVFGLVEVEGEEEPERPDLRELGR